MEALRFSGRRPGAVPTRTAIDAGAPAFLTRARSDDHPTVFVVRNDDLDTLRGFDGVIDRGHKHPRIPLGELLIGHDRCIPLIAGSYRASGRVLQGVRDLLKNARRRHEHNVYVIGVDEDVFRTLWTKAPPDGARRPNAPTDSGPVPPCQALMNVMPDTPVPADLERRFVGTSRMAHLVRQLIVRAAATSADVLILGDTGTGKEVVAHCIHEQSGREPFVHVNCAAYAGEQLETALFGKEGAPGLWRQAESGVLFLDEIGGLRSDHQARVMRALEERRIRPLDARRDVAVPARVVASSNRDLFALMQADQFLEKLYYRLRAFTIPIPPLRKRPEDIRPLADFFWRTIVCDQKASLPRDITTALRSYGWPGNARELKAVLSSMHALFGHRDLRVEHLRAVLQERGQGGLGGPLSNGSGATRQIETLRHLRHVDEVIRACEVTVRPLLERRPSEPAVASAHDGIHYRLRELDLLCAQPDLFGGDKTFMRVHNLEGKLLIFHRALETDVREAVRYWQTEVEKDIEGTLAAVVKAEGRVANAL